MIEKQRLHWLGLLVHTTCGIGRFPTGDIVRPKVWNAQISHPNLDGRLWAQFGGFCLELSRIPDKIDFSRRSWPTSAWEIRKKIVDFRRVVISFSLTYTLRSTKLTTASWTLRPAICSGRRSCFCKDTFGGGCLENWDSSSLSSLNGLKQSFERMWRETTRQHKQPFTP